MSALTYLRFREALLMYLRSFVTNLFVFSVLYAATARAEIAPGELEGHRSNSEYTAALRWGKPSPDSNANKITDALNSLFKKRAQDLNFSKRDLTNLLEESMPRQLGRLFPFRKVHSIPSEFFFENFAPLAFLVGEINPRVPPILAETETAEWLELKSLQPIPQAREFNKPVATNIGLRALAQQGAWSNEVFSAEWSKHFDSAAAVLEQGGLRCSKKAATKNTADSQNIPVHFRCGTTSAALAQENNIPKQLPRKVTNATAETPLTQASAAGAPTCVPMGRLNMQALEMLGDEKAGHCVLWRASRDERFQQRAFSSKLICLNSRHKSFQRTRFNSVVAVLPSSRQDSLHLVESDDGLLSSHRLSLATLTVSKNEVTTNSGQNLRNTMFPQQRTGLYLCQSPTTPNAQPFLSSENVGANVEWVYVDDSIYAGLRNVRPETDVAWRIKETSEASVSVERLNWSQLQYDHPAIVADRPFTCAAARNVDMKCGLRIVQTALQISEEWIAGDFERSAVPVQVQLSAALVLAQSLEKTIWSLSDWALREETEALFGFFRNKVRTLSEDRAFAGAPPRIEISTKTLPPVRRYLDLANTAPEYRAIKNSISSTGDFWATLKQKPL